MQQLPSPFQEPLNGSSSLPFLVFDSTAGQFVPTAATAIPAPASTTQVIFNLSGFFAGSADLTFDDTNDRLAVNGGTTLAGHLQVLVDAGANGLVTQNATTDITGYAIRVQGSAAEPYFYVTAAGSPRSPYTSARFVWYEGFNYGRLNFETSGEVWLENGGVGSTTKRFGYIDASNAFKVFDSSVTGSCLFAVDSGGDLTITPSGDDAAIVGTLTNTAGGATARVCRGLSTNSADSSTITTTASETNFDVSYTVPAGLLNASRRAIRVTASGTNVGTVSTPTVTIRLKWGSTTLFACSAIRMSSTAGRWAATCDVICRATGASGTLATTGDCIIGSTHSTATRQNATVDLTASATLQISAQMSTSSASNTITLESLVVEAINC